MSVLDEQCRDSKGRIERMSLSPCHDLNDAGIAPSDLFTGTQVRLLAALLTLMHTRSSRTRS